ncbi:MAG: hypothetical protein H6747_09690 [Deltaproteobacteria bacterium]|nr:hypothetical protein [Deltaproteobacteria bacterium]
MALPGFRSQTFALPLSPAAAVQVAAASSTRSRLLLSLSPGVAGYASLSPEPALIAGTGLFLEAESGLLELCAAEHGSLAQVPLFATGSAAGMRLTVIEIFGSSAGNRLGERR